MGSRNDLTAPDGYRPCERGCGRWSRNHFDPLAETSCYQCCGSADGGKGERYPDWTPPLESKPAETGKCEAPCQVMGCNRNVGNSAVFCPTHQVHAGLRGHATVACNCKSCQAAGNYDGPVAIGTLTERNGPPAQEAPKAEARKIACVSCGAMSRTAVCQTCLGGYRSRRDKTWSFGDSAVAKTVNGKEWAIFEPQEMPKFEWFTFTDSEGRFHGLYATATIRDEEEAKYKVWMKTQSGTPCAGPERLPKAKLAHIAGNHDDDLVSW